MFVYKPRNLETDAMMVNAFSEIHKNLSQYNLNTQKIIYNKEDIDGEYGYAAETFHSNSRHLTGAMTQFLRRL